ncbi:MAG TPA: hypothetical protein VGQ58_10055 [Candidatus Limnocylindrales bacterium]|jgi:hypothetical protein|nr:hypothetical protein [Candidatus Limnocylindrales bacterium]
MLDVLLLWSKSDDAGLQDEMISKLLPLMKEAPGLRRLRVSDGDLMARGGPPPYSRVVEASFGSLADWMAHVDVLKSRADFAAYDRVAPLIMFFDARDA